MISDLYQIFLQHPTICTDSRKITPNCIFFALKGDNFNGNKYAEEALQKGAAYAVIDEETYFRNDQTILVSNVLETLQQLANYHRKQLAIPIIALTGSNGKTTTKELINAVLSKKYTTTATKGNLNNHIGVPLTLLSMDTTTEIGIVEMGANHHKEIEFLSSIAEPDYGYITNFGKAHLEGFGSPQGVITAKSELYDYIIANNNKIFVNGDDPIQNDRTLKADRIVFGGTNDDFDIQINFLGADPMVHLRVNDLQIESNLIGDYNFPNIAAAVAMGIYFKIAPEAIKDAVESYVPTNNRSQIIEKNGKKIILDAYNANPTSMKAALSNFSNMEETPKIVFLGDMFELGETAAEEHQFISDYAATLHIDHIHLVGENFYNTSKKADKITLHKNFETLQHHFPSTDSRIFLIKGSRGMALERILDLL